MEIEIQVNEFIEAVKRLDRRTLVDFTKADVTKLWDMWAKIAQRIKAGTALPPNLRDGRKWAARLEVLEKKLVQLPFRR